jgi:hypothetical protein
MSLSSGLPKDLLHSLLMSCLHSLGIGRLDSAICNVEQWKQLLSLAELHTAQLLRQVINKTKRTVEDRCEHCPGIVSFKNNNYTWGGGGSIKPVPVVQGVPEWRVFVAQNGAYVEREQKEARGQRQRKVNSTTFLPHPVWSQLQIVQNGGSAEKTRELRVNK